MTASFSLPASGISVALPPVVKGSPSGRARLSLSGHPQPLLGAALPAVRSRTCVAATSQSPGAGSEHAHLSGGFRRGPRFPLSHALQLRSSQGPPSSTHTVTAPRTPPKRKHVWFTSSRSGLSPGCPAVHPRDIGLRQEGGGRQGDPRKHLRTDRGGQKMFKNQGGLSPGSWPSCWTPPPPAQGEGDIWLEESILQTLFAGNKQTA